MLNTKEDTYLGKYAIIIGSMKCGTTILYDYLCANPLARGYPGKEAHYYSLNYETTSFPEYLAKFSNIKDGILIDASPTYFDCSDQIQTLERIKSHAPNSTIIVLIRDPVERALSHFNHLKHVNKIDSLRDVSAIDFFSGFDDIDNSPFAYYLKMTIDFSFYYKKLVHLFKVFSPSQIVALDNSFLSEHPSEVMRIIYSRLGSPYYQSPVYGLRNYMSGTSLASLNDEIVQKLKEHFTEDYRMSRQLCLQATTNTEIEEG
jgi:hypothetical protein